MITFLQRYVYNTIMMFQQQGTTVTIMVYGRDQYRLAYWKEFSDAGQVQVCRNLKQSEDSFNFIQLH